MNTNEITNRTIARMHATYEAATRYKDPTIFYNLKPKAQGTAARQQINDYWWMVVGAAEMGITLLKGIDEEGVKRINYEQCVLAIRFEELRNATKVQRV